MNVFNLTETLASPRRPRLDMSIHRGRSGPVYAQYPIEVVGATASGCTRATAARCSIIRWTRRSGAGLRHKGGSKRGATRPRK